jgi:hypothetical protein
MARNSHIRVERVQFLASLRAVLNTFETFKAKEDAAHAKHDEALEKWARDIVLNGKYEGVRVGGWHGITVELTDKVSRTRPKMPTLEQPENYSRYGIEEIKQTIRLLEMSTDDSVSTYTYNDVVRYL